MDPINNSRMKEQMRLNNNAEANRKASEIDSRVLREINALKPEKKRKQRDTSLAVFFWDG